jgi:hypothetical protein
MDIIPLQQQQEEDAHHQEIPILPPLPVVFFVRFVFSFDCSYTRKIPLVQAIAEQPGDVLEIIDEEPIAQRIFIDMCDDDLMLTVKSNIH